MLAVSLRTTKNNKQICAVTHGAGERDECAVVVFGAPPPNVYSSMLH